MHHIIYRPGITQLDAALAHLKTLELQLETRVAAEIEHDSLWEIFLRLIRRRGAGALLGGLYFMDESRSVPHAVITLR